MTQQVYVPPQQTMLPPQPTTHMAPQQQQPYQPPRRPVNAAAIGKAFLMIATFGIAVAALVVSLTRSPAAPAPAASTPTYSATEVAAAKTKACTAAAQSIAGLKSNLSRAGATTQDDALGWANTAVARTALLTAAVYLPREVDPATPEEIRDSIGVLSSAAGDALSVGITNGTVADTADVHGKSVDTMNVASKEISRLCNAG